MASEPSGSAAGSSTEAGPECDPAAEPPGSDRDYDAAMLPLDTATPPTTAAEWRAALASAIARRVAGPARVTVADDFATVDVDLSGCRLIDETPPDVAAVGPTTPGPTVGRLHLTADPLTAHGVAGGFDASADAVRLAVGRNAAGSCVATIESATNGRLTVRLTTAAVDARPAGRRPVGGVGARRRHPLGPLDADGPLAAGAGRRARRDGQEVRHLPRCG